MLAEGLPQAQRRGGEALLPVALGVIAVHGGHEDPVGDRAQQFGLVPEVPVQAGRIGPERRRELAHAERLRVTGAQELRRRVQDFFGRPTPSAGHLAPLVRASLAYALAVARTACIMRTDGWEEFAPWRKDTVVQPSLDTAGLDAALENVHRAGMPGLFAEVRAGEQVWRGAAGVADAGTGRPVTADLRHRVGSITKTFTAAAVL